MSKIARARVKVRRFQEKREEKKLHKLALQRNKALREAERQAKLAKAQEEKRGAQLKLMKVKGIKPKPHKSRKKVARDTMKGIAGALRGTRKFIRKHSRE